MVRLLLEQEIVLAVYAPLANSPRPDRLFVPHALPAPSKIPLEAPAVVSVKLASSLLALVMACVAFAQLVCSLHLRAPRFAQHVLLVNTKVQLAKHRATIAFLVSFLLP
jgi:hypothetical protein